MELKQVGGFVLLFLALVLVKAQELSVGKIKGSVETPLLQYESVPIPSVTAECNETAVYVEVKKDLLGFLLGNSISISALTLGSCSAKKDDLSSQILIYESELDGCDSKMTVTEDELVYVFTLGITSEPSTSDPISIECHYPRFRDVPRSFVVPKDLSEAAEEPFLFSLRLMMDDWISERPSKKYYLGELINIEASVLPFNSVPLRVLADGCVATAAPDLGAVPRYSFIENYGCLIDAQLTQSSSQFMPQIEAAKLRIQLDAFMFQEGGKNGSLVYVTCFLKARAESAPPDALHKACFFSDDGWTAVYGADQVCSCCDDNCSFWKEPDQLGRQQTTQVMLGPITVEDNLF